MDERYRGWPLVISITVVILLGAGSRMVKTGLPLFDNYVGDALYAVLGYLLLTAAWRRGRPRPKAAVTAVVVIAIETFELTGIPYRFWTSGNLALRWLAVVLGTHFGWWDIVAYLMGITAVCAGELRLRKNC